MPDPDRLAVASSEAFNATIQITYPDDVETAEAVSEREAEDD